jgi:ankyrin repeat protein
VLLQACSTRSLSAIEVALRNVASINATTAKGETGLSRACCRKNWEAALPIVKLLLAKRFAPSMINEEELNALHCAARLSSAKVVALLLGKMQKNINTVTNKRYSALSLCCIRFDEEAVVVARVLLDAAADIESVEGDFSRTPLLLACLNGRPELVSLLLERGANVKAVDRDGDNALTLACANGAFGREMIPLLVNAGVDVLHKANDGDDAMTEALFGSGAMAETMS